MVASLKKWSHHAEDQTRRIESVFQELKGSLSPSTQFLIAEILIIRTTQVLEEVLPEVFGRMICGAKYLDGTLPVPLHRALSVERADKLMRVHGRKTERRYLKWLSSKDIGENVKHLLAPTERCLRTVDKYSAQLDEIRAVRNHAAHRISGTKEPYRKVLERYYGSHSVTVPVGKFLVSERFGTPPILFYTKVTRALVKEICAAPLADLC